MTANKNLKKLIRRRMRKTDECYTAARRHFLQAKEAIMITGNADPQRSVLSSSIDQLELTLKVARVLKSHDIGSVGELVEKTEQELLDIGLGEEGWMQVREVLASRGL